MMQIMRADRNDLEEILKLQYLAYQSEAQLVNDFNIQPLTQTLEELMDEYEKGVIYKAVDDKEQIIGSVRGYVRDGTIHIGKLMVHPNFQGRGRGIGTSLLRHIENEHKGLRKELFTSDRSIRNIKLYERNGYKRFKEEAVSENLRFVYLEKAAE
ncbi:GNAT family N-acetyltransferase [Thermoclostridium caenicola]|nr:GNAT family N-acetyltransferase [Thermoclostridium caenicola]